MLLALEAEVWRVMRQLLYVWFRNAAAVIAGILIYLAVDIAMSVLVGRALDRINHYYFGTRCYFDARCYSNTILFQVMLRLIVVIINFNLMSRAVNRIAVRNDKGHSPAEYIVGGAIIISVAALEVIGWCRGSLDAYRLIFSIFNVLLGIMMLWDAKEDLL